MINMNSYKIYRVLGGNIEIGYHKLDIGYHAYFLNGVIQTGSTKQELILKRAGDAYKRQLMDLKGASTC